MASKRILKQKINYVCSNLFAECMAASLYSGGAEKGDTDALLKSILMLHNQYVQRVSHAEPGMLPKIYYKNLITQFDKEVAELIDQIANIS